ncbi:MAG: DUF2961 domain-containing protein [Planctomycetota bacterium]
MRIDYILCHIPLLFIHVLCTTVATGQQVATRVSDANFPLVQLPAEFESRRTTKRVELVSGKSINILDAKGPGCVRHFWVTSKNPELLEIEITTDDTEDAQIKMTLYQFFGVLLGEDTYRVGSGPIKVLPKSGFNSYFPIPFDSSCKITLRNLGQKTVSIWSMANWHQYETGTEITALRLHAIYSKEDEAEPLGTTLVGAISGRGFVAGLFHAIKRRDERDVIWHTGGDTWLIDGENKPHVMRGIGIEDLFGHSFGVHEDTGLWLGGAHVVGEGPSTSEVVAYRFFGVDSVAFKSSLVLRLGTRANQTQSVLYFYKQAETESIDAETPQAWTLSGPFDVGDYEIFQEESLPGSVTDPTIQEWRFGKRSMKRVTISSEHTWVDFTRYYRFNQVGNGGTQPSGCAAYATTTLHAESERHIEIYLGFDDWIRVWLNGEPVATLRHDQGFDLAQFPLKLCKGANTLVIRLSNHDNLEWRCWAFSCKIKDR